MSPVGFEPTTPRLKGACSTPELRALKRRLYNNNLCLGETISRGVVPYTVPSQGQNRSVNWNCGLKGGHLGRQVPPTQMGVTLCHSRTGVAQEALERRKIVGPHNEVRGEGMSKPVKSKVMNSGIS